MHGGCTDSKPKPSTRRHEASSCPWRSSGYAQRKCFPCLIPNGSTFGQSRGGSGNSGGTTDCSVIGVLAAVGMVGANCRLRSPLDRFAGEKVNNVRSPGRKGRFSCMKCKCCCLVLQCCSNVQLLGRNDLDNFFPHKQNQWSPIQAL